MALMKFLRKGPRQKIAIRAKGSVVIEVCSCTVEHHDLMAIFQIKTGQRECFPSLKVPGILQEGVWHPSERCLASS